MMKKIQIPWIFFSCLFWAKNTYADVEFSVEGLDKALEKNVMVYLDAIPQADRLITFRLQSRVSEEVKKALQALGYFNSSMQMQVKDQRSESDARVVLTIDSGPATHIAKVDVQLLGEAQQDPSFTKLLEKAPKKGDVLDQGKYDDFKSQLQNLAVQRGYFNAKFTKSSLEVAPGLNQAFIYIYFDSGERFNFGHVFYYNSQIEEERLASMAGFEVGQPYLISDLGEFNQKLSNSGWFSSVLVEAEIDALHDGEVPILVKLEPAPRNKYATGLGYSTDSGPRVKMSWDKPWINSYGHSLQSQFYVSKDKQTVESNYIIPLNNASDEYYQVQLGAENLVFDFTNSLDFSTSISRHWKFDEGWQRILYLRWLFASFDKEGTTKENSSLLLPGVNFSRIRTRGGTMPTWGDKHLLNIEVSDDFWGSDASLIRVLGQSAWIRSLNDNNRFISRFQAGGIYTEQLSSLPPTLRFFAGGDNSVRGYQYQSISPKDSLGQLIGGKYLATGSLEYNYRVTGNWWGAVFTDAGDAWTDSKPDWRRSVGLGVRWQSPVGPVRLDIAHGLDNPDHKFMIHFGLGPEL